MTERLLQKLTALDEYSEKVMDMRILKNQMQDISMKKSLHIPLTFDFHTGFEKPVPKITASKLKESFSKEKSVVDGQKMDNLFTSGLNVWKSKIATSGLLPRKHLFGKTNVRPYSVPSNLKYHPLVKKLQPSEAPTKLKSVKPFLYPKCKDKAETGHMMPWFKISQAAPFSFKGPDLGTREFSAPYYQSQPREKQRTQPDFSGKNRSLCQKFVEILDTTDVLPKDDRKSRKQVITPKDLTSLQGNPGLKTGRGLDDKTMNWIPLSFEDELNKPNTKIINLSQSKQVASSPVLSNTNPIIFHDTGYVEMFLLTKNRYYLKNREKPIDGKTNLVLKKNNEIIRTLISDPLTATFCPKEAFLDEWRIDANMPKVTEEKSQRKKDIPSAQVPDDTSLAHKVSLESEKSCEYQTLKPSQFQYSSNSRHSRYLQNFRKIHNTVRMTHLDNLLNTKPPKLVLTGKATNGRQEWRNIPQIPGTFKYSEKFPASASKLKKVPVMGTAEEEPKVRAEEEKAPPPRSPYF